MIFKKPSLSQYITSLIITSLLAGLVYVVLQSRDISDTPIVFVIGLLVGHLAGVFIAPPAISQSTFKKSGSTSVANGEIISLYVGNLAYNARRDSLNKLFSQYGPVKSVRIMTDRETRRPRGYGFVEMEGPAALTAIKKLDGTEFCGRTLRVSEANQR